MPYFDLYPKLHTSMMLMRCFSKKLYNVTPRVLHDVNLLLETKKFLSSNFDMKDLGEASFILGIDIHRDRRKGVLGLSQKAYLEKVLKKYSMHACKPSPALIVKGDSFGEFQCPRNQYEIDRMKAVSYASVVGSLQYAQVCARPDLAFVIEILGRY